MSTAIKNALLRAASNELSNQPVLQKLLQALIDNIAGINTSGDVVWSNDFFVDPILGDDTTAVPGSLKFTYKNLQTAFNAASNAILISVVKITARVIPLPGTHNLGPGSVEWPNTPGIHLMGLDRSSTLITNDGDNDIIKSVAPLTADNFTGSISNLRIDNGSKKNAVFLDRTGAGLVEGSVFTMENVEVNDLNTVVFTLFDEVHFVESEEGDYTATECTFTTFDRCSVNSGNIDSTDVCNVDVLASNFSVGFSVGAGGAPVEAHITMDRATTVGPNGTFLSLTGNTCRFVAQANLGDLILTLPDYDDAGLQQNIDFSESAWSSIQITGTVNPGIQFPVLATGCQASNPPVGGTPQNVAVSISGNVALDIRGLAGFLCDSSLTCSVAGGAPEATCDRDYVDLIGVDVVDTISPPTYPFLGRTDNSFPAGLSRDDFVPVFMALDTTTAGALPFYFDVDTTVVPNEYQFRATTGLLLNATIRMMRRTCAAS